MKVLCYNTCETMYWSHFICIAINKTCVCSIPHISTYTLVNWPYITIQFTIFIFNLMYFRCIYIHSLFISILFCFYLYLVVFFLVPYSIEKVFDFSSIYLYILFRTLVSQFGCSISKPLEQNLFIFKFSIN